MLPAAPSPLPSVSPRRPGASTQQSPHSVDTHSIQWKHDFEECLAAQEWTDSQMHKIPC